MSQTLDRPGTFRANITHYVLRAPFKSGAVAVEITALITAEWTPPSGDQAAGTWEDWTTYGVEATGLQWLVKSREKGGGLNKNTVENLMAYAGWDGNLDSLYDESWQPIPCQIVCHEEPDPDRAKYNEFPIAFVNAHDSVPGTVQQMAPDALAMLKAKHGAGLRALAGNVTRNAPAPSGAPPTPPKPPKKGLSQEDVNAELEELAQKPNDDIPF